MTLDDRPLFERGVRLSSTVNGTMLLVPEGAVRLNRPAEAALSLVDGSRTVRDITLAIGERFAGESGAIESDVLGLFEHLAKRRFVVCA
ncbi:MAG: hypothetical protein NVSMB5_01130 [Candidatus Velthaea sp.]